jgi:hypothetical protein
MRTHIVRMSWIAVAAITLFSPTAGARVRESWPSSKLIEKADVIVIARLIASADAKTSDKPPKGFDELIGVDSTFKVLGVIKGKVEKQEFVLFHFRSPPDVKNDDKRGKLTTEGEKQLTEVALTQSPYIDLPGLVGFDPRMDKKIRYLMFLKKRPDGRYECVSGQVDPNVSISKLDGESDDWAVR